VDAKQTDVPPCRTALETMTCQSIVPEGEAMYILEVTSGFIEKFNIDKNSKLSIISI